MRVPGSIACALLATSLGSASGVVGPVARGSLRRSTMTTAGPASLRSMGRRGGRLQATRPAATSATAKLPLGDGGKELGLRGHGTFYERLAGHLPDRAALAQRHHL